MYKDLSGERYGRLVVVERHGSSACQKATWLCQCDCGNTSITNTGSLHNGTTRSCGCLHKEEIGALRRTHGMSKTRLYEIWSGIKKRCYYPNNHNYQWYGGKGIKVCDDWRDDFEIFRDWAMCNGYNDKLTIERNDLEGDYSPENCRWITMFEQHSNTSRNLYLTINGETKTLSQWSRESGIHIETIRGRRKRGVPNDNLLDPPLKKIKGA